jgi:hypothetical protein
MNEGSVLICPSGAGLSSPAESGFVTFWLALALIILLANVPRLGDRVPNCVILQEASLQRFAIILKHIVVVELAVNAQFFDAAKERMLLFGVKCGQFDCHLGRQASAYQRHTLPLLFEHGKRIPVNALIFTKNRPSGIGAYLNRWRVATIHNLYSDRVWSTKEKIRQLSNANNNEPCPGSIYYRGQLIRRYLNGSLSGGLPFPRQLEAILCAALALLAICVGVVVLPHHFLPHQICVTKKQSGNEKSQERHGNATNRNSERTERRNLGPSELRFPIKPTVDVFPGWPRVVGGIGAVFAGAILGLTGIGCAVGGWWLWSIGYAVGWWWWLLPLLLLCVAGFLLTIGRRCLGSRERENDAR